MLQDYTGIPAIADLAAMRDAVKGKNKNPDILLIHYLAVDLSYRSFC